MKKEMRNLNYDDLWDVEKEEENELSEKVYKFIEDLKNKNEDYEAFDLDFKDLKIDEEGNIYYPTDYEYIPSSYCDADTGYNTVDESEFEWLDYQKIN